MKALNFALIALLSANSSFAAEAVNSDPEIGQCRQHLQAIYDAIQHYRTDHKKLPDYFTDLVPLYIADKSTFLCPKEQRTNQHEHRLSDISRPQAPELPCHYSYEFSALEHSDDLSGRKLSKANVKSMQMAIVGGGVPLVRCLVHRPVLNVSFDGRFFESEQNWHLLYTNKVPDGELSSTSLLLHFMPLFENTKADLVAFARLEAAAGRIPQPTEGKPGELSEAERKANLAIAAEVINLAQKAGEFTNQFPQSSKAKDATSMSRDSWLFAAHLGHEQARERYKTIVANANDPALPAKFRCETKLGALIADGTPWGDPSLEQPVRAILREFPDEPGPYFFLLQIAEKVDETRRHALCDEMMNAQSAPEPVKSAAKRLLKSK